MSKVIQTVKTWRYPCDGEVINVWDGGDRTWIDINPLVFTTKNAIIMHSQCECGKNCKPERITITVERI